MDKRYNPTNPSSPTLTPIDIDAKSFLERRDMLPALPAIVFQIQAMMQQPDKINVRQVGELISSDPALVAQVLKIVNSAYYALPNPISDVKLAVAYLGINEISRVTLSVSVMSSLTGEDHVEFNKIWMHSTYSAICARYLAGHFEPLVSRNELWSAAILHDLGKLVYLKYYPDHYKSLTHYAESKKCMFEEAERVFNLPASSYFGGLLCEHWQLPETIKDACLHHDLEDLQSEKGTNHKASFQRLICLGNLTAVLAGDELDPEIKKRIFEAVIASLALSESEFLIHMAAIIELRSKVERWM